MNSRGYFAQDHGESITKGMTAIGVAVQFDPAASQTGAARLMGSCYSRRRCTEADAGAFRRRVRRLIFCRVMLQKPNFLCSMSRPTTSPES